MKKLLQLNTSNEKGASLAELLATITILSIIMLFFVNVFISSSKVNHKSSEQVDATYVAQKEIENIYGLSVTTPYSKIEDELSTIDYVFNSSESVAAKRFFDKNTIEGYDIKLTVTEHSYTNLTSVFIDVKSDKNIVGANTTAEMELLMEWRPDSP